MLYLDCPVHQQRKLKNQIVLTIPAMRNKIKLADVLNKHQPKKIDVIVCGSKTAKQDSIDSKQLQTDIEKRKKTRFRIHQKQNELYGVKVVKKKRIPMQNLLLSRFRS